MSDDKYDYVEKVPDAGSVRKRGSAFARVVGGYMGLALLLCLIGAGVLGWGYTIFNAAGPLKEDKIVDLAAGMSRNEIAEKLASEGVISDYRVMSIASLLAEARGASVRSGEYMFPARATMADVLDTLLSGRVLTYKLTIPEGWTSEMAVARINDNDVLSGLPVAVPAEGTLVADTQVFQRGMTREKILKDMQEAQAKLIDEVWARKPADSPLQTKEQMVTLASLIEKETAKADERPKIAAVFLNRLKKNMRLQSDPTIIYGLVGGKGKLDRALTRADIDSATPYNTYQINGLPPGPIATPGRAALEAAVTPDPTDALYFVADGTGGHAFASTLEEHNANVKKWRAAVKSGILLPEGNNGTVSPDPNKIMPEVEQAPLPAVDDVVSGEAQPAVDDKAVAEAAATKDQTQAVPQPKQGEPAPGETAKPVAAEPPPLPASKPAATKVETAAAEPPAAADTQSSASSTDVTAAPGAAPRPGSVIKVGERLVPIPQFKPPKP